MFVFLEPNYHTHIENLILFFFKYTLINSKVYKWKEQTWMTCCLSIIQQEAKLNKEEAPRMGQRTMGPTNLITTVCYPLILWYQPLLHI